MRNSDQVLPSSLKAQESVAATIEKLEAQRVQAMKDLKSDDKDKQTAAFKKLEKMPSYSAELAFDLAWCYAEGKGVEKDISKASEYLKASALGGFAPALESLYQTAVHGRSQNLAGSNRRLCLAASLGHRESLKYLESIPVRELVGVESEQIIDLGDSYMSQKKYEKALECYSAASAGNGEAALKLGQFYEKGVGDLKADVKLALNFYQQAADRKNTDGMLNLARCYAEGIGLDKNVNKAVELYKKALGRGDLFIAPRRLAIYHAKGLGGLEKDLNKGKIFLGWAEDIIADAATLRSMRDQLFYDELNLLKEEIGKIYYSTSTVTALKTCGLMPEATKEKAQNEGTKNSASFGASVTAGK